MGRFSFALLFAAAILFTVTQDVRAWSQNDDDGPGYLTTRPEKHDHDAVRGRNHHHFGTADHDHHHPAHHDHPSAPVHYPSGSGADYDPSPFIPPSSPRINATEVDEVGFVIALAFGACIYLVVRQDAKKRTGDNTSGARLPIR